MPSILPTAVHQSRSRLHYQVKLSLRCFAITFLIMTPLIVNAAITTYYRQKVAFIARQSALYAASAYRVHRAFDSTCMRLSTDSDAVRLQTNRAAVAMMKELNLPPLAHVDLLANATTITAHLTITGPLPPCRFSFLPAIAQLDESASADLTSEEPSTIALIKTKDETEVATPCFGFIDENAITGPADWNEPYYSFTLKLDEKAKSNVHTVTRAELSSAALTDPEQL